MTPEKGEAGWRGARRDDCPAAMLLHPPPPTGGGETGGGTGIRVERRSPSTTGVSSILTTRVSRVLVTDNGNRGQPACPEEWKMCKEEHE
jgi:hypothetical protein